MAKLKANNDINLLVGTLKIGGVIGGKKATKNLNNANV